LKSTNGLAEEKRAGPNRELRKELGPGEITLALNENRTQLWVTYRPKKRKAGESRWYRPLDTHFRLESANDYDARRTVANAWDLFHSSEDYISCHPGVSFKGVCLFIAGLQADTQDQSRKPVPGEWVEIALKPQSRILSMNDVSLILFHEIYLQFIVLTFCLEQLQSLGKDLEVATKRKSAAESAARMSTNDLEKKKKKKK
jgi:hypothetical protein